MGIESVLQFHRHFKLPDATDGDQLLPDHEAQAYRLKFLQEELDELREALQNGDRVKAFDALLDLEYVLHGTALFMGVGPDVWNAGAAIVHMANMTKVRVVSADESKRGSAFDVCKPPGWVAPEPRLREILRVNR